jgi:hypothetical protein
MSRKPSFKNWISRLDSWVVRMTELKMSARLTKAEMLEVDKLVSDLQGLTEKLRRAGEGPSVRKLVFKAIKKSVALWRLFKG